MAAIDPAHASPPAIRPPGQRRTREQWRRILDAGVDLLIEHGYEGFTIAAMCAAAAVPPRALYARAASKQALFIAVYDHGMAAVHTSEESAFAGADDWAESRRPREVVARSIAAMGRVFDEQERFLGAVMPISAAHPEIAARNRANRQRLADRFVSALAPLDHLSPHPDPTAARHFAFLLVFATLGAGLASGDRLVARQREQLVDATFRYLVDSHDVATASEHDAAAGRRSSATAAP